MTEMQGYLKSFKSVFVKVGDFCCWKRPDKEFEREFGARACAYAC